MNDDDREAGASIVRGSLPSSDATDQLGRALAHNLAPGDFVGLTGGLGVGKSHLARAVIREKLALENRVEETPSPTYTLVQTYETQAGPLRHADLYRLGGVDEVEEIGLFEAAETTIFLVEWPDRLGALSPDRRLEIHLEIATSDAGETASVGRRVEARALGGGWRDVLAAIQAAVETPSA